MSPNDPIHENESIQESTHERESQKPLVEDSQESKRSRPQDDGWAEAEEEGSGPRLTEDQAEEEEEEEEEDDDGGDIDNDNDSGRERLKRHRVEMAGRVWIPDMWGQEDLLKDWADCASFDASLVRSTILMARDSLANEARTTTPHHSNAGITLNHTSF